MAKLIIFLGATGSGKSTQAKLLADRRDWDYVSSGDLLRASNDPAIQQQLDQGRLVDSLQVEALLADALARAGSTPVVLDGFPRFLEEAEWLEAQRHEIAAVCYINIDRREAWGRLAKRGRHDDNQALFEQKWQDFQEQTQPVVNYYRQQNRLVEVNGVGTVEEVADLVERVVND